MHVCFHWAMIQQCCFHVLQDLNVREPDRFPEPEINGMLEFEWNLFIEAKKKVLHPLPFNSLYIMIFELK